MGFNIGLGLIVVACAVGGLGVIRSMRAVLRSQSLEQAKGSNRLFYAAAALSLAAVAVIALAGG